MKRFVEENIEKLTPEQKAAFDKVMSLINEGGIVFMDAPGGTGKTFTSEIILAVILKLLLLWLQLELHQVY